MRLVQLVSLGLSTSSVEFALDLDRACTIEENISWSWCLGTMSKWNARTYLNDFSATMLRGILPRLGGSNGALTSLGSSTELNLLALSFSILIVSNFTTLVSILRWLIGDKIRTKIVHINTADSSTSHDRHCTILLLNHLSAIFLVSNTGSILNRLVLILPKCIHNLSSASWALVSFGHLLLNQVRHVFTLITCLSTSISMSTDILRMCSVSGFFWNNSWARSSPSLGRSLLLERNRPWFRWVWTLGSWLLLLLILNTTLIQNDHAISNFRWLWWFFRILSCLVLNVHRVELLITIISLLLLLLLNTILNSSHIWVVSQMVDAWPLLEVARGGSKLLLPNRSTIFVGTRLLRSIVSSPSWLLSIIRGSLLVGTRTILLVWSLSIVARWITCVGISICIICRNVLHEPSNRFRVIDYEVVYVIVVDYVCDCMTLLGIWLSATLGRRSRCRCLSFTLVIFILLIGLRLVMQEVVASLHEWLRGVRIGLVPHFIWLLFWWAVGIFVLNDNHPIIFRIFLLFVFFTRLLWILSLASDGFTSSSFSFTTSNSDPIGRRLVVLGLLHLLLDVRYTGPTFSIIFINFKAAHDLFFIHLLLIFSGLPFFVKHFRSSRGSWSNILGSLWMLALLATTSTIFHSLCGDVFSGGRCPTFLSVQIDFIIVFDASNLGHREFSIAKWFGHIFLRNIVVDLNFLNFFRLEQIVLPDQIFEVAFFTRDLVDPLESILLGWALGNSEVSERTHLGIYESISENELFSGYIGSFFR